MVAVNLLHDRHRWYIILLMGEESVIIRFVFKTFLQQIFHQCPAPILVVAYTGCVDRFMYLYKHSTWI